MLLLRGIFVVLVLMVLFGLLVFGILSSAHAAGVCSQNTFAEVASNREIIAVFSGEEARNVVQRLDSHANHDWAHTTVKVVSGGHPDYVHLLIVENNCVVSIIGRTMVTYQAAAFR